MTDKALIYICFGIRCNRDGDFHGTYRPSPVSGSGANTVSGGAPRLLARERIIAWAE
jgi:hypothetical protein